MEKYYELFYDYFHLVSAAVVVGSLDDDDDSSTGMFQYCRGKQKLHLNTKIQCICIMHSVQAHLP